MSQSASTENAPRKGRLLTFSSGGWVLLLAGFFSLVAALLVLYPAWKNGLHREIGDGQHLDSYGFDLSNLTIPRSEIVPFFPKDFNKHPTITPGLVETATPEAIDLMAANEHIRFLVPDDRVIGVEIYGESRCYPVRIMLQHEICNDVLGGMPIAVTYTPLCDAAVVFDRRIDVPAAPPVEFGYSGLYLSSNTIFFDRRSDPKQESLWPQLTLHAISGPAAAGGPGGTPKQLSLIPYQLVTWQQWRTDHPDTRVLLGLRTFKVEYGGDPYSLYLNNDDINPVVLALPPTLSQLPNKTRIVITPTSSATMPWIATLATNTSPPLLPATTAASTAATTPIQIHTFLFAWYAQHPNDTDYAPLLANR